MSRQAGGEESFMQQLLSLFNSRSLCPRVRNLGVPLARVVHANLRLGTPSSLYLEPTVGEGALICSSLHLPAFPTAYRLTSKGDEVMNIWPHTCILQLYYGWSGRGCRRIQATGMTSRVDIAISTIALSTLLALPAAFIHLPSFLAHSFGADVRPRGETPLTCI